MSFLTLVGLPIGNIGDLTTRVKALLREESIFFVEDTRTFRSLLQRLEIDSDGKKIISFHDHSEEKKLELALEFLKQGKRVCLASEAGSPVVSDPAYPLISAAIDAGFEIETLPAVSSVVAALELSGLPPNPFHFHGFLPREEEKKNRLFNALFTCPGTHIFFEAPNRIMASVTQLGQLIPQGSIVLVREITKKFQSVHRFTGEDWPNIAQDIVFKGEFVLLFYSAGEKNVNIAKLQELAEGYLQQQNTKLLAKLLGELTGRPVKTVYNRLVE